MSYNLTGLDWNATNLFTVVQVVNTQLEGLVSTLLLLLIFIACLAIFRSRDFVDNWNISSFITVILSSIMWFLSLIPWEYAVIPLSLMILGLLIKAFSAK